MTGFAQHVGATYDTLHKDVHIIARQQDLMLPPLTTLANRCQEMAGAIC
jgi:hypothetical protein